MTRKPTVPEKDAHAEKYPLTIRFRANNTLQEQLGFGFGPPDVKNYLLEIEQDFAQEELV